MINEYSQLDISDKFVVGNLMIELTTKKLGWSQPIHDHVTSMENLASKTNGMGMEVNYNTIKEKWNFQEVKESASTSRFKANNRNKGMGKEKIPVKEGKIHKEMKCFFCKKNVLYKNDYPKRKKLFKKNDESFLTVVHNNTWWLDSGAKPHVSHIVQGFLSI
ncbi:hypothetical protein Lal_00024090 [Lupinus albus]|nr:hypothetical protein Lal_00024090 [Lupinus albus]